MVDTITPAFARRYRGWCERYAPHDLDHFDGLHEEPHPECPKCQHENRPVQGTLSLTNPTSEVR